MEVNQLKIWLKYTKMGVSLFQHDKQILRGFKFIIIWLKSAKIASQECRFVQIWCKFAKTWVNLLRYDKRCQTRLEFVKIWLKLSKMEQIFWK